MITNLVNASTDQRARAKCGHLRSQEVKTSHNEWLCGSDPTSNCCPARAYHLAIERLHFSLHIDPASMALSARVSATRPFTATRPRRMVSMHAVATKFKVVIEHEGQEITLEVPKGKSILEVALDKGALIANKLHATKPAEDHTLQQGATKTWLQRTFSVPDNARRPGPAPRLQAWRVHDVPRQDGEICAVEVWLKVACSVQHAWPYALRAHERGHAWRALCVSVP